MKLLPVACKDCCKILPCVIAVSGDGGDGRGGDGLMAVTAVLYTPPPRRFLLEVAAAIPFTIGPEELVSSHFFRRLFVPGKPTVRGCGSLGLLCTTFVPKKTPQQKKVVIRTMMNSQLHSTGGVPFLFLPIVAVLDPRSDLLHCPVAVLSRQRLAIIA